jgi:ArsR family transcriptional regulator
MFAFMNITKALADENRVRALLALQGCELCACQIIELLGLAPSTVSRHMSILKQARLVQARKDGRWMYYRLPGKTASAPVREAIAWIKKSLANDRRIQRDAVRLKAILAMDREILCGR